MVSLPDVSSISQLSSCERFDLAGDVPDKPAQLARDGDADLVLWQLPPHAQVPEALCQAQLCPPGDITYGFGLALLAHLQHAADSSTVAIGPGGFDELMRAV